MQRLAPVFILLIVFAACAKHETPSADTVAADNTAATATTVTSPAGEMSPPPTTPVAAADRAFVEKAARTGMAEVQLATNVSNRAQTQEVRSFAQQMITDHNRSNQELTTLAAQKGIDPPADLDPEKKALDTELAKLNGPPLDKAYMEAMVKDHATAAADFEAASQQLSDPDLKAWAAKTLPVLHQHHKMAQDILGTIK
jgi:putative membrane protein